MDVGPGEKSDDEGKEQEKPFLLRVLHGHVLAGQLNSDGNAEFEWARVPPILGLETSKDHLFLKRGMDMFEQEFKLAQLSFSEFRYRGQDSPAKLRGFHTVESRGLVVILCCMPVRKQCTATAKEKTFQLLKSLVDTCMTLVEGEWLCMGTIFGTDCDYHTQPVRFTHGTTSDFGQLLQFHSKAAKLWSQLQERPWCGHKISSSIANATPFDILFYLLFAKCHKDAQHIWVDIGRFMWPQIMFMIGNKVEECARLQAAKAPEPAPLLKTKKGHNRRVPFINKMLLLKKVKFNKAHRRLVMSSHDDLVPSGTGLVSNEPLVECTAYMKLLKSTFSTSRRLQVSWDPSNYSVQEVLVATVYSNEAKTAGYLPIQCLLPITTVEVSEDIQLLAVRKQVTRVDGFNELRALAHALIHIEKPLELFFLPGNLLWQPLKAWQARVIINGKFYILDRVTEKLCRQIPDDFQFAQQHVLVSISDQGGINKGVLDYCCNYLKLCASIQYDQHHRTWNDLKSLLKSASLWRCFLSMAMMFNVSYGPQNSKTWFLRKQRALAEYARFQGPTSPSFLKFLPLICSERGETEDGSNDQKERMFQAMLGMRTCQICGPLTKLMRWWSWWECHEFYLGELWMSKLVMLSELGPENIEADAAPFSLPDAEGLSPQQELRQLKMKHVGWALAPSLITEESMWQKTLIFEVGKPLWSLYSKMSKEVQKPSDVLQFTINMSMGGWVEELASLISNGFFEVELMKKLYHSDSAGSLEHLQQHTKVLINMLNKRAMSLVATYLKPPYRYAALVSPQTESSTRKAMQQDWIQLLTAEELAANGKQVPALEHTHFLGTAFARLLFLANEMDIVDNLEGDDANGVLLARSACEHLGDTVVIENTHQKAKDLLRSARHSVTSRLGKFHSVITSNVLKGRGVNFLQVDDSVKASATFAKNDALQIVKATHPNSHFMQNKFQEVMKYGASRPGFSWATSSHFSLFNEAACLELLLADGCLDLLRTGQLASAPITCIIGSPGSVVASKSADVVLMVLAVGTLNFLAWEMQVVSRDDDDFVCLQLCRGAASTSWHSVTDLQDWLAIPYVPKLHNRFGPLVFQQSSAPLALPEARVVEGLSLTVAQCNIVLKHYDIQPAKSKRKAELYMQIIELFVDSEEERKLALERSDLKGKPEPEEDGDLSELEDLLDHVEEAGNIADPDIKAERQKIKKAREKAKAAKMLQVGQENLLKPRRGRGRGRGKGRGRGAVAKGRGKGKFGRKAFGRARGSKVPDANLEKQVHSPEAEFGDFPARPFGSDLQQVSAQTAPEPAHPEIPPEVPVHEPASASSAHPHDELVAPPPCEPEAWACFRNSFTNGSEILHFLFEDSKCLIFCVPL